MTTEALTPEVVADKLELELVGIQSKAITVVDLQSHDNTIAEIRATKAFVERVEVEFEPILSPLQAALDAAKAFKKKIVDPANQWMQQKRQECATWQSTETKRLAEEHKKQLEAINEANPWEEKPAQLPTLAKPSTSGAGLRNKPWDIIIESEDDLWKAAVEDPRFRAYWTPNVAVLKAAVKSRGNMLNVPGVKPHRGTTLNIGR